jgi:arylsulfatase A-like enzyme
VIFCSHRIDSEDPALIDIAPTALRLFGLPVPAHMDGRPLFDDGRSFGNKAEKDSEK